MLPYYIRLHRNYNSYTHYNVLCIYYSSLRIGVATKIITIFTNPMFTSRVYTRSCSLQCYI